MDARADPWRSLGRVNVAGESFCSGVLIAPGGHQSPQRGEGAAEEPADGDEGDRAHVRCLAKNNVTGFVTRRSGGETTSIARRPGNTHNRPVWK